MNATKNQVFAGKDSALFARVGTAFRSHFGLEPAFAYFAPGRVEVLGNHTDYNEGFVLSSALAQGVMMAMRPADPSSRTARLYAADLEERWEFDPFCPAPASTAPWANYILGVLHGLMTRHGARPRAFDAAFGGDLPLGAGLSSSAALSVASALALAELLELRLDRLAMARVAQQAEHEFAGVRCGLLDQISSLFGRPDALVFTDFRTFEVQTVPLPPNTAFLLCNTGVKHRLVDSAYNERRAACERAAAHFAQRLSHPVHALRDVSMAEWAQHREGLDPEAARRAAHVIGENERVLAGVERLRAGDAEGFGALMSASHESSRTQFENSCPELNFCVEALRHAGALGARLSGGGFGGSVIALARANEADTIAASVATAAEQQLGRPVTVMLFHPAGGARRVAAST